jgi:nitrite reductase/ring-hydroxylating ferredoxin subunit
MAEFTYYAVAFVDDLAPGERVFVEIGDLAIVVFNVGGQFYAMVMYARMMAVRWAKRDGQSRGHLPPHGARFDIRDGRAVEITAAAPTQIHRSE